jgi:hypothetical protein
LVDTAAHEVEHQRPACHVPAFHTDVAASGGATLDAPGVSGGALEPDIAVHAMTPVVPGLGKAVDAALSTSPRAVEVTLSAEPGPSMELIGERPAVGGADSTIRATWGSVAVLPKGASHRARLRPGGVALSQRRRRVPWELIRRERLLAAWARILREHGLEADDVRLVGVFGPLPLGALFGAALDPDGERAVISLRRTRVPGPPGDLALARHVPSGRLVSAAIPRSEGVVGASR